MTLSADYKSTPQYLNATKAEKTAMNRAYRAQEQALQEEREAEALAAQQAKFNGSRAVHEAELMHLTLAVQASVHSLAALVARGNLLPYSFRPSAMHVAEEEDLERFRTCITLSRVNDTPEGAVQVLVNQGYSWSVPLAYVFDGQQSLESFTRVKQELESLSRDVDALLERQAEYLATAVSAQNAAKQRNAERDDLRATLPEHLAVLVSANESV